MKSKAQLRKEHILDTAIGLANDYGYTSIRRDDLARRAGVAQGTINLYFATMTQLKRAVMRRAIVQGEHRIVAQGLAGNDPQALSADQSVKDAATEWLASS